MTIINKKKRIIRQYTSFLFSLLASIIGLLIFFFCSKLIPFPDRWLPKAIDNNGLEKKNLFLFFTGISLHLQVNFYLGFLFLFLDYEKIDYSKLKKIKFWVSKVLIFIFSLLLGLSHYWNVINKRGLGSISLLCLLLIVVNCCLVDLLIQLMNQYGICNAFSLILFTEFIPFKWIQKNITNMYYLTLLLLITSVFVWITNLKWEVPIETNSIYIENKEISEEDRPKLGFRLNLSFIPLIYLSNFIEWIHSFILMRKNKTNWFNLKSINLSYEKAKMLKLIKINEGIKKKSFWECFFIFNMKNNNFNLNEIKKMARENLNIIKVILFFIFLRWLFIWLQMRKLGIWRTKKMSKDLRNHGVYIDEIAPGWPTRQFLKNVINKLILLWNLITLVFNFIFDTIFLQKEQSELLLFMNWFGGIGIAIDLINQIKTKYKYIKETN